MKYKLIIDKDAEEEIIAIVHTPSFLTQEIEDLVHSFSGADFIIGHREEEIRKLSSTNPLNYSITIDGFDYYSDANRRANLWFD